MYLAADQEKRYPFQKSWRWHFVRLFDYFFDRFSGHFRKISAPTQVHRILVIRLDHIGDLICSLPALSLLRKRFPEAVITVLTSETGEALLKNHRDVHRILLFKRNWFSRGTRTSFSEWFRVVRALRKENFDIGFDLRGDIRNILLMVFAGVRYRVGYGIGGGSGLLHRTEAYDPSLHQVELNAKLIEGRFIPKDELKPEICLNAEESEWASGQLKRMGLTKADFLISLHPEAGYP